MLKESLISCIGENNMQTGLIYFNNGRIQVDS